MLQLPGMGSILEKRGLYVATNPPIFMHEHGLRDCLGSHTIVATAAGRAQYGHLELNAVILITRMVCPDV